MNQDSNPNTSKTTSTITTKDAQTDDDPACIPVFLGDDYLDSDIPKFIMTTTAREMFGQRDDETLHEAIARSSKEAQERLSQANQYSTSKTPESPPEGLLNARKTDKTALWLENSLPTIQRMATDETFRKEISQRLS